MSGGTEISKETGEKAALHFHCVTMATTAVAEAPFCRRILTRTEPLGANEERQEEEEVRRGAEEEGGTGGERRKRRSDEWREREPEKVTEKRRRWRRIQRRHNMLGLGVMKCKKLILTENITETSNVKTFLFLSSFTI